MAPTMTSGISTFLESLAPASAGVGLLESGSRLAEGKPGTPPTPPTPPDSEMGATAGGRSASNATSAKRSNEPPRAPPADASLMGRAHSPLARTLAYIRTFRAVADTNTLAPAAAAADAAQRCPHLPTPPTSSSTLEPTMLDANRSRARGVMPMHLLHFPAQ